MKWLAGRNSRSVIASAAVAAVTAAALAGAPALAQNQGHRAPAATTAAPVIKSGWKNGPISINTGIDLKTVVSMSLTKGSWAIFAKAYVQGGSQNLLLTCQLVAGVDYDVTRPLIEAGGGAYSQSIALNVVHKFLVNGSVKLRCATYGVPVTVNFVKITAIKAGSLTNVQLR